MAPASLDLDNLLRPRDIYAVLNDDVVFTGRGEATLSVAVYNHDKAFAWTGRRGRGRAAEVDILLLGPTGCGRRCWRRRSPASSTCPSRSPTRLRSPRRVRRRGRRDILLKLIQAADFDIKKAETGIIYIDGSPRSRARRTTRRSPVTSPARACSRLLKTSRARSPRSRPRVAQAPAPGVPPIDTTNILFICGGVHAGLDRIIRATYWDLVGRDRCECSSRSTPTKGRSRLGRRRSWNSLLRPDP